MKTITDYNKEFCEFGELNNTQKCIILREDIVRLLKEYKDVTLCEAEMCVIIKNKIVFSDLLDLNSLVEKSSKSEDVSYIIKKKNNYKNN